MNPEYHVLAAMQLGADRAQLLPQLDAEWFLDQRARNYFEAVRATDSIDPTVLSAHLGDKADPVWWSALIVECEDPTVATTLKVVDILKARALRTRLSRLLDDPNTSLETLVDQVRGVPIGLEPCLGRPPKQLRDQVSEVIHLLKTGKSPVETTPTGYVSLDGYLGGGYAPGRLYILGARPGVGKSAFTLSSMVRVSHHHPVGFISCEMTGDELAMRAIAQMAGVNGLDLQSGKLDGFQLEVVEAESKRFHDLNFLYEDEVTSSLTSALRTIDDMARSGAKVVVVDYIQLLTAGRDNRVQDLSVVSRELKLAAKRLHIAIVAPSQLRRWDRKGDPAPPGLQDLRESGSIEQDADFVGFLHPDPERDCPSTELASTAIDFLIRKNRSGTNDIDIPLRFLGPQTEFRCLNEQQDEAWRTDAYWDRT